MVEARSVNVRNTTTTTTSKRLDGIICYYVRWRSLHNVILDVRATKLQQALETDIYSYENIYQVYVALFKSVVSVKEIYKSLPLLSS